MVRHGTLLLALLCGPALARAPSGPSCIDTRQIVGRQAGAPDRLTLTLTRKRQVDAQLAEPCPHLVDLDRDYTIVFDHRDGDNLCRGDRFQVVDPRIATAGGAGSFPFCRISRFVPSPGTGSIGKAGVRRAPR